MDIQVVRVSPLESQVILNAHTLVAHLAVSHTKDDATLYGGIIGDKQVLGAFGDVLQLICAALAVLEAVGNNPALVEFAAEQETNEAVDESIVAHGDLVHRLK